MIAEDPALEAASEADESDDSELALALETYLGAVEAGGCPDLNDLTAQHPAIAQQLRACVGVLRLTTKVDGNAQTDQVREPEPVPHPEMRLGDFRMLRPIGRGGMGIVYEAEQISLHRRVALKVLPFAAALDHQQLMRFQTEAQAAAQLHHTNIVPVFSVGCEHGVHYYAMQFIDGQTVSALIRDMRLLNGVERPLPQSAPSLETNLAEQALTGQLITTFSKPVSASARPESNDGGPRAPTRDAHSGLSATSTRSRIHARAFHRTVAQMGIQAAEALEHAHRLGIIHRDIKPANLIIDVRGNLWITDFGLARIQADTGLTITGDVVGTLRYMSPEQALARRGGVDHRTDIYSLGVTLYELLTLRPAFAGQDRQELLRQLTLEEPAPIRRFNSDVPSDLETVILKAMSKEQDSRYDTAQEMADDLRRFLELKPIKAKRPNPWERLVKWTRRHTPLVAASMLVLVLAVLGLGTSTAVIAAKEADVSAQRDLARENAEQARHVVDQMYSFLSQRWLSEDPADSELKREFLLKAAAHYEKFTRTRNTDRVTRLQAAHAWLRVGEINWTTRRLSEAESAYNRAVELFTGLASDRSEVAYEARHGQTYALIRLGDVLFVSDRHTDAERPYRRALELAKSIVREYPDDLSGWFNLGNAQFSLGDVLDDESLLRDAESTYRGILGDLAEGRRNVQPIVKQMLIYQLVTYVYNSWSVSRAIESGVDARKALLPGVYLYLAIAFQHQNRYSEAAACMHEALKVPGQDRFARASLTEALAENLFWDGHYRESIDAFRESLKLVPNEPKTLKNLASRLLDCPDPEVRNPAEAARLAERALEVAPHDRELWQNLARAYYHCGDWSALEGPIRKVMAMNPPSSDPFDWLLFSIAKSRSGERELARTWYDKAVTAIQKRSLSGESLIKLRGEVAELLGLSPAPRSATTAGTIPKASRQP
jgi:serine/threonine protein kinase/Flp pilus assembly protein TadD